MKKTIINQVDAIALLKEKKNLSGYKVSFDSTPVEALDAILLGKNGFIVPSNLIWYDEDSIDYSDDPALTDEDLKTGKIKWIQKVEIPLHNDIRAWIKKERIDLSELLENLLTDFYKNVKSIPKKKGRKKASKTPASLE
ncbi:MAG: hypothetical protein IPH04_05410 [Saprospirales bacterium]|jgi:hypothetical protein|nr:hypothetical protein [Saprospirales bacterium]